MPDSRYELFVAEQIPWPQVTQRSQLTNDFERLWRPAGPRTPVMEIFKCKEVFHAD